MIGDPLTRREDERVLRGQTRYVDDIELPRLGHVAFVRSPFGRARITGIERPESLGPGAVAMFTASDMGASVRPFPVPAPEGVEIADEPHPILASDEVRYFGQAVVAVIAGSRALAEDAAELVEVDYEALPVVTDARRSDSMLVRWSRSRGDVAGGFAAAAHVVRGRYGLPRLAAVPIEARGCVAEYDPGRDELTIWCSAQDTHRPLAQLSHILARPEDSIHLIVPDVGGAFGSKGVIAPEMAAVAWGAIELGQPLKWVEDRFENFLTAYQGRGIEGELELALDQEGRMLALRARLYADVGGYLLSASAIPPHTAATLLTGCYDIPAAEVSVLGARTNKAPTGPYRGAGRPDAAYLLERLVDDAARATGIDRIELRRRNLIRRFPHQTPLGLTYDSGDYERCLDVAVALLRADDPQEPAPGRMRGAGVALFVERAGGQWESAEVEVEPSGRMVVRSSSSPHGQGHETTFAQIVAGRVGVSTDTVVMRFGDSAETPRGVGTFGSRSVAMAGSAVAVATEQLISVLRALAAHQFGVAIEAVTWTDGAARAGDRTISLSELARAAYQPARLAPGMEVGLRTAATFRSELVFSSGAYGALVEIEQATGRLHVLRLVAVDDAGTIINPLLAHGQVIGGAVQGLGECLVEEVVYDDGGQPQTASLLDYSLLTAAEIPTIVTGEVSTPTPLNPLGAKGVGEGGAIGTLAAVANAVADALGGRHVDPPYTGEKLWRALR